MNKCDLFSLIDAQQDRLFDMACQIHDRPEIGGEEYFASGLLTDYLEKEGFRVERGIGGLETAFRATWHNGTGGPNIGLLGEYDALKDCGHGCGHHMQTPAAIGAAIALREWLKDGDLPCTITVYGTPAEESFGGKITMGKNGCFQELDVALNTHATGKGAFVGGRSKASQGVRVTFHGKSAHAAGSPHMGRSAADAMLLAFHGVEFMREHIKDGCRMHYTLDEALGPSNVVPDIAKPKFTLRSYENDYLDEMIARFRKIVEGACLMTETTADVELTSRYAARKRFPTLAAVARRTVDLLGLETDPEFLRDTGGSTDFGNVCSLVPGVIVFVPYVQVPGHSVAWVEAGTSEIAATCVMNSAKVLAGMAYDLLTEPELLRQVKEEFSKTP